MFWILETHSTIYREHIDDFGLSFYPVLENNIYYVDPCDRNHYISLDDYYLYMKKKRVAELQRIAQSLGATHFKVTYKEKSKSVALKTAEGTIGAKAGKEGVDAKASRSTRDASLVTISIEAEMKFLGHSPVRPELHYLKKKSTSLI